MIVERSQLTEARRNQTSAGSLAKRLRATRTVLMLVVYHGERWEIVWGATGSSERPPMPKRLKNRSRPSRLVGFRPLP